MSAKSENLVFLGIVVGLVTVLFGVGLAYPHLTIEDGVMESLAAIGFAIPALLVFGPLVRPSMHSTFADRLTLAGLCAFSLLLFLSEISFGARMFGIQMPKMRGGGEFDGGHDVVILLYRLIRDGGSTGWWVAGLALSTILGGLGIVTFIYWRSAVSLFEHVMASAFEFRLAVAFGMLSWPCCST